MKSGGTLNGTRSSFLKLFTCHCQFPSKVVLWIIGAIELGPDRGYSAGIIILIIKIIYHYFLYSLIAIALPFSWFSNFQLPTLAFAHSVPLYYKLYPLITPLILGWISSFSFQPLRLAHHCIRKLKVCSPMLKSTPPQKSFCSHRIKDLKYTWSPNRKNPEKPLVETPPRNRLN